MANRLARETSPYLLQHSDNPVDWYPWGEEALGRAREQDRPILLSVGYSACHWCHVMERESFEDPETAAYMNEHFVNVKVDREERPDVDAIYMEAVQAMSGQGGWPMTVFLDPDGVPFYGGTYFPPDESRGMPSFRMVMEAVVDAFERKREEIRGRAAETRERLGAVGASSRPRSRPRRPAARQALRAPAGRAPTCERGGFGGAPKFPPASALELLLATRARRRRRGRRGRRDHARRDDGRRHLRPGRRRLRPLLGRRRLARPPLREDALRQRAARPRLPARLAGARARALAARLRGTLDWMLREMRGPEGGFYSALDADSEGEEGRFYVWTPEEIREVLGERSRGGRSTTTASPRRATSRAPTSSTSPGGAGRRPSRRREPPRDARRGGRCSRPARSGSGRGSTTSASPPGTRWRSPPWPRPARCWGAPTTWRRRAPAPSSCSASCATARGACCAPSRTARAHLNAYLEDHAFLLEALLALYEASFEQRWYESARELAETMIARFGDPERGGFFSTSDDHEGLIARRKEIGDHPIPSGNSLGGDGAAAPRGAQRRARVRAPGRGGLPPLRRPAPRHPDSFAHLLRALDFHLSPTREVALVGDDLARSPPSSAPSCAPTWSSPAGRGHRGAGAARGKDRRSRAGRPPTSASTSAAGRP